jgi:DNA polymerase III subunit epsilon
MMRLAETPLLVLDAQATAASPVRGALVEIGWARGPGLPVAEDVEALVVAPPLGAVMPRAVARITGIRTAEWERGVPAETAWRRLSAAAAGLGAEPAPLVVHYARFEEPHLVALHARHGSGAFPFQLVCTHAIARRLLPGLPRRTLRALAGYFGAGVSELRRAADHVVATAFVWRHLVVALEGEGVTDLASLRDWLSRPTLGAGRAPRAFPLERDRRLELPRGPGVYRMHRAGGAVVYVGKATSLRHRVSSHFQARGGERALEMLSQVREVSCRETATALEAALLEADEIKRLAPPYNRALLAAGRSVHYASRDLDHLRETVDARHVVGPLGSAAPFAALAALRGLLDGDEPASLAQRATALGLEPRWAPAAACFEEGRARFVAKHGRLAGPRDVRRVGARLWRERRAQAESVDAEAVELLPRPAWTPEAVLAALEETVLRAAHGLRRARWLVRLSESTLAWSEPGGSARRRLLVLERGRVVESADLDPSVPAPLPPGAGRPFAERRASFDVATFDRLRVLTTELRALADGAAGLDLRVGAHARLSTRRLGTVLRWV